MKLGPLPASWRELLCVVICVGDERHRTRRPIRRRVLTVWRTGEAIVLVFHVHRQNLMVSKAHKQKMRRREERAEAKRKIVQGKRPRMHCDCRLAISDELPDDREDSADEDSADESPAEELIGERTTVERARADRAH